MVADAMPKFAVLIDADNARHSNIHRLLAEIAKYGTVYAKRAYGDWSSQYLIGWKDQLLHHSIQPIQQFAYTQGKNATDSAMIIDAMDLLYTSRYDGFCLVSSDSDFTKLASRIRESGLVVYGFGEQKTPKPFVAACNKFIYTENLVHVDELEPHATSIRAPEHRVAIEKIQTDESLATQLRTSVEAASGDDGWASLSEVGALLTKRHPEFDSRSYGYHKLSDLIAASSLFETNFQSHPHNPSTRIYVRDTRRKSS
ncbi:hypothetical protein BO83DRAFT_380030 [Aspergillus eucalypticola CBS 122712]|uniref:HTH OST-type domain-containing protein n=1 Tax=Aspergillus eucalypticola (strain CBS 122712 / IBT 29274) TaxID=1448314 RepID=A0A317V700_ASPEC|nr:uncharacterized protein BO83DRAFT_380030 [Aspergillus eucalypticola CBS 122712]PWY68838.1 hypothetical protein BO83DRAFT_380030 [Aspergillus eucalypticola CBS 122712]